MSGSMVSAVLVLTLTGLMAAGVGLIYSTGSSDSSSQDIQPCRSAMPAMPAN
jgi:hypothetical protein